MEAHSSTLAWKIPWMEEPVRLQSMGSQRVRHNLATKPPPPLWSSCLGKYVWLLLLYQLQPLSHSVFFFSPSIKDLLKWSVIEIALLPDIIQFRVKPHFLKVKSLSRVRLFATPRPGAYQVAPSMGFSRQECRSELPFPSPGDLPDLGIEPRSPALQADALPSEPPSESLCNTVLLRHWMVLQGMYFPLMQWLVNTTCSTWNH